MFFLDLPNLNPTLFEPLVDVESGLKKEGHITPGHTTRCRCTVFNCTGMNPSNNTAAVAGGDALRLLPDHVLTTKVFRYFNFKDYALTSCASQYLQTHWQLANQNKPLPLYVPEDCRTLGEAARRDSI